MGSASGRPASSSVQPLAKATLPEYEVVVVTIRAGTQTLTIVADDTQSARTLVESECLNNECHCPPECCTDDVHTEVVNVRAASANRPASMSYTEVGRHATSTTSALAIFPEAALNPQPTTGCQTS